jgi:hypothetical protein
MLSSQERQWLLDKRVYRATDNKEVQIYPMGAERYLSAVLKGQRARRYDIKAHVIDQTILVIPGFGTSAFLFAEAGAKSVTVYDKDPVTLAWMKAFKLYYHYREACHYPSIGEVLDALMCWYPPILTLPTGKTANRLCWLFNPQWLRRTYIFYMIGLVQQALCASVKKTYELSASIEFHVGTVDDVLKTTTQTYDAAFVPYLLGVKNGIEAEADIVAFIKQLMVAVPQGPIFVNPSRNTKEFYVAGKHYFVTTPYRLIQAIPGLKPYFFVDDPRWFGTQGLAIFRKSNPLV